MTKRPLGLRRPRFEVIHGGKATPELLPNAVVVQNWADGELDAVRGHAMQLMRPGVWFHHRLATFIVVLDDMP